MATSIPTGEYTKAKFFPDYVFNAEDVPQDTNVASESFVIGGAQAGVELVVEVATEIALPAGEVITVDVEYGDSFANSKTIYSLTGTAVTGSTIPVGELARFIPESTFPVDARLKITTDSATVTGAVTAWLDKVSR